MLEAVLKLRTEEPYDEQSESVRCLRWKDGGFSNGHASDIDEVEDKIHSLTWT